MGAGLGRVHVVGGRARVGGGWMSHEEGGCGVSLFESLSLSSGLRENDCKNDSRFYDRMCALPFDLSTVCVSSYRILLGFAIIDALS